MSIYSSQGFSNIGLRRGKIRQKPNGFRRVRHIGGRLVQAESGGLGLAVLPILPGETLMRWTLQFYACSDSHIQPDSAIPYEFLVVHDPTTAILSGSSLYSSDAAITSVLTTVAEGGSTIGPYEDDPATGNYRTTSRDWGREVLYSRDGMLTTLGNEARVYNGVAIDSENHVADKWSYSSNKKIHSSTGGAIIFGTYKHQADAETNWGISASGITHNMLQNFKDITDEDAAGMSANDLEAFELIYGGDKYIEADTWKEDDFRAMIKVQALFKTPFSREDD